MRSVFNEHNDHTHDQRPCAWHVLPHERRRRLRGGFTRCQDAPECVAYWQRSHWDICPDCDGTQWRDSEALDPCSCWSGLIEVAWPDPAPTGPRTLSLVR